MSLDAQVQTPAPVVKVWVCLFVTTWTVAGRPLGSTEMLKLTVGPLAEALMARLLIGPKVVTVWETEASHGDTAEVPPWLPLQS